MLFMLSQQVYFKSEDLKYLNFLNGLNESVELFNTHFLKIHARPIKRRDVKTDKWSFESASNFVHKH